MDSPKSWKSGDRLRTAESTTSGQIDLSFLNLNFSGILREIPWKFSPTFGVVKGWSPFSLPRLHLVGGFNQPLWKICAFVKLDDFPRDRVLKKNMFELPPPRILTAPHQKPMTGYPFGKCFFFFRPPQKIPLDLILSTHLAVLDPEKISLNGLFSLLNIRHPQKFKAG